MRVSVLCTVLDNRDGLRRMLKSLVGQKEPYEVIVVDGGSKDGSFELAKEFEEKMPLTVVWSPGSRGHGHKVAAEYASGDILAFIGSDDWATKGWVQSIRRGFERMGADVAVGMNYLAGLGPKVERVPIIVDGQDISHPGCNTFYRREVYEAIGGIDESFETAEDVDLNYRAVKAGYQIKTISGAVVQRSVRPIRGLWKQAYWNGYGRGQLEAKHGPIPGMIRGAAKNLVRWWDMHRLAAGYLGYKAGRTA